MSTILGFLLNPRALFAIAGVIAAYTIYHGIDARGYRRGVDKTNAEWKARHVEAAKIAKTEEIRLAAERNKENEQIRIDLERSRNDALTDAQYLRSELARQQALAKLVIPRTIVRVLDPGGGAGALPSPAPVVGGDQARADAAVPGPSVELGPLLERVRANAGICERNTERLTACIASYNSVRDSFIRLRNENSATEN
jgi:hypothetical protein